MEGMGEKTTNNIKIVERLGLVMANSQRSDRGVQNLTQRGSKRDWLLGGYLATLDTAWPFQTKISRA